MPANATEASTATDRPLLTATALSCGYHGHPVVQGFDLTLVRGEVVAMLGANGAGKTTTLMTLAGVLKAIDGEVALDGAATTAPLFRRARAGLGIVTEERSVFMGLSVADNLRVGRCDVKRALDLFPELEPLRSRRAGLLSGGEQQMLTLARVLARRPRLLLADELSLGLAPIIVNRLLEAVRRAATEDGVGVLLVEQHVNQALRVADRAMVMSRGRIVLSGGVDYVAPRLKDAYIGESAELSRNGAG